MYFRVTQMRAEILGPDDSPTTGSSVSSVVLPLNLAPAAWRKHQISKEKDAQEGIRTQYFTMVLGCGTRTNIFGASSGPWVS